MIQWIVSSSLLLVVLIGLRFLLRGRIKPRLQYALWALALARLVLPISFGSVPISVENTVEKAPLVQEMEIAEQVTHFDYHLDGFATGYYTLAPVQDQMPDAEQNAPVTELFTHAEADRITHLRTTKENLRILWVGGMAIMAVAFLVSNVVFALRLRKSRKLLEKGRLPIYATEATETPCLFGLFRPAIYLTPAVAEEEHHRTYAIAHETTHYRHGDFVWSVLRSLCLIVHWYNPLVWWAAILSRADGEIACDEATISDLGEGERAEYGRVLIDLTCRKTTDLLRTATTMTGSAKGLKERIKMIAKRPKMAVYTLIAVLLVAAITVGCTFTGAGEIKTPTTDPIETTEPMGNTDPVEVDYLQAITGTPLTEDELAYFTELFAHKGTVEKEEDINWYNLILSCGWNYVDYKKGFTVPEDVNLDTLFNNGFREISSPSNWTAEEMAFIQGFYPGYPENWGDIDRLPADRMNKVLQDYFGITLEQSNKVSLDMMYYFADTDCYFGSPAGAIGEQKVKMTAGKKGANGTVYLLCTTDSSKILDGMLLLALNPAPEGSARPYWVQMCIEINDPADVASVLQPANPEKEDELKNIAGTSLTDSELAYFTELFAGTTQKGGGINWYNYLLSCGRSFGGYSKGFMIPEDVNLETLFNGGCRDANTTRNWTAEELAFVQGFYPEYTQYSSMVYRLPVEKMNEALQDYLGITLEQSNKVWLDRMYHFPDTNCYFVQRSGMVGEQNVEMLAGKKAADGTVHLICITEATKTLNSKLVVSLVPAPEGAAKPYWVQACIQIKGDDDPSSIQQPTVQEYSKVKNGYVPFIYNGRPLMTATARIDTTNLEVGKLYICDPTTYKIYLVADEKIACFDATSEHLYYVIEGGNQVIRCDYGDSSVGENKTVVYSTVGTITSIDHYGTHANDKLLLVEDGKTAVLYRPETGEHKQLFTAHMIYDIRYENNAKRLDKKKSGHVVFWMGLPEEDSDSDSWLYYISSGEETWMDKPDDDTAGYGGWSDRYATGIFDGREFFSYAPMPEDNSWFQKDYLYTYDRLTGIYYQLSDSPVVRYCTTLKHDYMFFTDGRQMFRCDHKGGNMQLVYTSGSKITFADYEDGNELVIVEDESKVYLYNFTTGEKELLMEQPYVEDAFYYADSSKLDGRKKGRAVFWHGKIEGDPRINQYVYYIELDEMYNPPWL